MVRLDMSVYMEKHSVSRLIGAPPGYVGHEEGGQLTEAVRRKPYSVVLFDEVEKAHPTIWNILLQVLDDGRLTDSMGRLIDFSNTIIILTSNIGSELLLEACASSDSDDQDTPSSVRPTKILKTNGKLSSDETTDEEAENNASSTDAFAVASKKVIAKLSAHFRPEFLNRLDEIVVFRPLRKKYLRKIIKHQLDQVMAQLKADRAIHVSASDETLDYILEQAFEPAYGARPLRRYIERQLATDLATKVIKGDIHDNANIQVWTSREANALRKRSSIPRSIVNGKVFSFEITDISDVEETNENQVNMFNAKI
jgi:ATP-dependent Clp protease ATP-binding subunit ClpB